MKSLGLNRYVLTIGAASALLAGCGGMQSPFNGGVTPTVLDSARTREHQTSGTSGDLLYVETSSSIMIVSVASWQIVGAITDLPDFDVGICSDPNSGNVFVPQYDTVLEYAHGGTMPIATLNGPKGYTYLRGCSVDPITQNLAMTSSFGPYEGNPGVIIFPAEQNYAQVYRKKELSTLGDTAYDNVGNLYMDAYNVHGKFFIGEMKVGQTQINLIRLRANQVVGKMQWDGTYLVGKVPKSSGLGSTVYQLEIAGSKATVVGTVRFAKAGQSGFWISDGTMFQAFGEVPHKKNEALGAWPYPNGGKASATLYGIVHGKDASIYDLTVSVDPSR